MARGIQPVVASAANVSLGDEDPQKPSRALGRIGNALAWQHQAWTWFDSLGEVGSACTWYGSALSRIEWQIGHGPEREPARDDKGAPLVGVDVRALAVAERALDTLRGPFGTHSEWANSLGQALACVAEGVLVGNWVDEDNNAVPAEVDPRDKGRFLALDKGGIPNDAADHEVWEAYSPTSIEKTGTGDNRTVTVRRSQRSEPVVLPGDTVLVPIWRRDPRYPDDAWGPMVGLLDVCQALQNVDRAMAASTLSRTHAGILGIDTNVLSRELMAEVDVRGVKVPKVLADLIAGLSTPARDPASMSLLVPTTLFGKGDPKTWMHHQGLTRDIDPTLLELSAYLLKRFASGMDLPTEKLTGMDSMNHWGVWYIGETGFREHLEPTVTLAADGLTVGYLWPSMRAEKVPREIAAGFRIRGDATDLIRNPDRTADAKEGFRMGVLSAPATRRYLSFPETDAPTEEELRLRAELGLFRGDEGHRSPIRSAETEKKPPDRKVASSTPDVMLAFARQSAQLESQFLHDVMLAGDMAIGEAQRKASARLRSKAQSDPALRSILVGQPLSSVPRLLGRRSIFALVDDEDVTSLFAGAFADVLARYRRMAAAVLARWDELVADLELAPPTEAETAARVADVAASESVLEAGFVEHAENLLLTNGDEKGLGEVPAGLLYVPSAATRRASARAGGVDVVGGVEPFPNTQGGIVSGPRAGEFLIARGARVEGHVWEYGMTPRKTEFPPHRALDGIVFVEWTDSILSTDGTFGERPFWRPGDHNGCLCTTSAVFTVADAV